MPRSTASLRSLWDYGLYLMWLFTHMSVLPVYVQAQHGPLFHISPETCSPYNQAQIYQGSFLLTLAIICWSSPDLPLQNFNRASLFSSTLVSWHLLFPSQISKKPLYICIYLYIFSSLSAKWNFERRIREQETYKSKVESPKQVWEDIQSMTEKNVYITSYALHTLPIPCVFV